VSGKLLQHPTLYISDNLPDSAMASYGSASEGEVADPETTPVEAESLMDVDENP